MCVCVYVCSVAQLCLNLCDPIDCSPPGSSVHGIFQARILEWVDISYSRGSSQPRNCAYVSCVSCTGRRILHYCTLSHCIQGKHCFRHTNPCWTTMQERFLLHILSRHCWKVQVFQIAVFIVFITNLLIY